MALRCVLYMGMDKIISQCQIDIIQGMRQQDEIVVVRSDCKSTQALVRGWGREERGSPMYLHVVGQKKEKM